MQLNFYNPPNVQYSAITGLNCLNFPIVLGQPNSGTFPLQYHLGLVFRSGRRERERGEREGEGEGEGEGEREGG